MAKRKKPTDTSAAGAPTDPTPTPPAASNGDAEPIAPDRIAFRAYELYVARGGSDGRDVDDWLTAERELSGRPKPRE